MCFGLLCWIVPVVAGIAAEFSWQVMTMSFASLVLALTGVMLKSGSSLAKARSRGLLPPAGSCSDADVRALMVRGEKRMAIRLYRELHGGSLKEAREAVEGLLRDIRSQASASSPHP
jgi:ribosomal protein L7/L12